MTGAHHACGMLSSAAPARMAISRPSPTFVGIDAGEVIGPRRKLRTSSGSHSKPPVASTTPRAARTITVPVGCSTTTPVTRPSSMTRSCARLAVTGSTPRSRQALSSWADQRGTAAAKVLGLPLRLDLLVEMPGAAAQCRVTEHQVRVAVAGHHPVGPAAQSPEREQLRFQRPSAAGLAAGSFRVIVRVAGDDLHPQPGRRLQPAEHARSVVDEGFGESRADVPERQRRQVPQRVVPAVGDPAGGHLGAAGTQHPPPEIAVVPPTRSAFSNNPTEAPPSAAARAATSPAAPVPSTTTSNCGWPAGTVVTTHLPCRPPERVT